MTSSHKFLDEDKPGAMAENFSSKGYGSTLITCEPVKEESPSSRASSSIDIADDGKPDAVAGDCLDEGRTRTFGTCVPEEQAKRQTNASSLPRIKSFSRRVGRKLTTSRKSDLSEYLPKISVKVEAGVIVDPRNLFSDDINSFELEIGFGTGEHLVNRAIDNNNCGFIGCEPYLNGVAKITQLAKQTQLGNLKIYELPRRQKTY